MSLSNPEPSCFDCLYLFSLSFWYLSFAFFFSLSITSFSNPEFCCYLSNLIALTIYDYLIEFREIFRV